MSAPHLSTGPRHVEEDTDAPEAGRVRVAYLVSRYPSLSHAFIENEVDALRALGVDVHTFTVRSSPASSHVSERSRREAGTTTSLIGSPASRWVGAGLRTGRRSATALLRTAGVAAGSGPRTARARVWQGFYLAEAVLLFDELRARGIRHLHVHFANNGADIARLVVALGTAAEGPAAGWRWTMTMHGPTEFEAVDAFDLRAKIASAHAIACISDFCRSQLMRHSSPEEWGKLDVVRMAVDGTRFPDASPDRATRGDDEFRVLFVGRLVPEKGPSVLLSAAAALRGRTGGRLRVRFVGSGPLLDELQAQVVRDGLQDVVEFTGPLGNESLPGQYAWADVFCLPSFAEGVPVVLMEALATSLPVVTTAIAGIPELVKGSGDPEENGRLVPPGRPEALAAALQELRELPGAERSRLGAAGRRRVLTEFAPELNARRLLGLFNR
ncbi:glycosyltransferase family 4 protein [Kineococcus sp. SYSU DK001]|uniref:glycosyltransferase family 4 protein n=1 Tax=Kineococcus sp. SYSU DK001 TaxID=3383122 RepID=UPI003D7C871F